MLGVLCPPWIDEIIRGAQFEYTRVRVMVALVPVAANNDRMVLALQILDYLFKILHEGFPWVYMSIRHIEGSSLLVPRGMTDGICRCWTHLINRDHGQRGGSVPPKMTITPSPHGVTAFAAWFEPPHDAPGCNQSCPSHESPATTRRFST